jgi:hypothetical protein
MTTMYSIHQPTDVIERNRRRPRVTSTNARNNHAIFGKDPRVPLHIPLAIDHYNHHMNGADVANQRRKHLTTQRKHNTRIWRPLFHWLLDIIVMNCYILWRLQVRRRTPDINWDPVEFNRALADALLVYDPEDEEKLEDSNDYNENQDQQTSESDEEEERNSAFDLPQEQQETLQRPMKKIRFKISSPVRCKGVLLGIPKKVEATTDMRSIYTARSHTLIKGDSRIRRDCIGCKIAGTKSRPGGHQAHMSIGGPWAAKTTGKCLQCNVSLCVRGQCWAIYHNQKKYS